MGTLGITELDLSMAKHFATQSLNQAGKTVISHSARPSLCMGSVFWHMQNTRNLFIRNNCFNSTVSQHN
jgi:hypothetical protein